MKFTHATEGGAVLVRMSGELETRSCTCLENFWELRVAGHTRIEVDLDDVDTGDGVGVATLAGLVGKSLRDGARVTLVRAPQMLAHTFYKVGLLAADSGLRLVEPRFEEPYG